MLQQNPPECGPQPLYDCIFYSRAGFGCASITLGSAGERVGAFARAGSCGLFALQGHAELKAYRRRSVRRSASSPAERSSRSLPMRSRLPPGQFRKRCVARLTVGDQRARIETHGRQAEPVIARTSSVHGLCCSSCYTRHNGFPTSILVAAGWASSGPGYGLFNSLGQPSSRKDERPGLVVLRSAAPAAAFERPAMTWLCLRLPYSSCRLEGEPVFLRIRQWWIDRWHQALGRIQRLYY